MAAYFVLAVAGGYTFATVCNPSRYNSVRESGHRTYFRSVFYAFILYVVAAQIYLLLAANAWTPLESVELPLERNALLRHLVGVDEALPVLLVGSFLLAIPLAWLVNFLFHRSAELNLWLVKFATRKNDFESLLLDALVRGTPLLVTLANGKVYVGWFVKMPDPGLERRYLRLLSILSGYRSDPEQSLIINTNYVPVLHQINEGQLNSIRPEDLDVVIPADSIAYAHLFDEDAYHAFASQTGPGLVE